MIVQVRNRLILTSIGVSLVLLMGSLDVAWAQQGNRSTREAEREKQQRVADIFNAMGVRSGAVVADVGAGSGFFTVRLAAAVGDTGRVLAVDVKPSLVQALRKRAADEGLKNVEVIEGEIANPHLPEQSLDAALIVNAYHEMTEHQAMLEHIRKALKPSGRLVIIEPIAPSRRDASRDAQTRQHEIAPDLVQKDARDAGFAIAGLEDPFSNHHGHGGEYMLVLTPAAPALVQPAAEHQHAHEGVSAEALASPDLRIGLAEFVTLHRSGKVIVLDVRDRDSYERGRVPGAKLAPLSDVGNMLTELRRGSMPIVTYCSCPAEETSGRAALLLRKHGITNVRALTGGFEAWVAGGNRVERR